MPKRATQDHEWELWKDEITLLYRKNPMEEVIKIMAAQHGFFVKNVRKHEWDYIIPRYEERQKANKSSVVRVHSVKIQPAKIKKEKARRERQLTTYERLAMRAENIPRIQTPPGVVVRSPTPPSPSVMSGSSKFSHASAPFRAEWPGLGLAALNDLPWFRFAGSPIIRNFAFTEKGLQSLPANEAWQIFLDGQLERILRPPQKPSIEMRNTHLRYPYDTPYLPYVAHSSLTSPHATSANVIAARNAYFEVLKTLCGIIANNIHDSDTLQDVVSFVVERDQVLSSLDCLLRLRQPIMIAFAEKLLNVAILSRSLPLVKSLIATGIDVTAPLPNPRQYGGMTALYCAVQTGDEEIVRFLLSKHPTEGIERYDLCHCGQNFDCGNCLSLIGRAIESGNENILKMILQHQHGNPLRYPISSLRNLRLAVLAERLDFVQCLVNTYPELLGSAKSTPLPLLQAAAVCNDSHMFDALTDMGIKLHQGTEQSGGSVLTVAILASNKALVEKLLTILANDELRPQVKGSIPIPCGSDNRVEWHLYDFATMSPLNAAIVNHNEEVVEILLRREFDPNAEDGIFPLQLASQAGNYRIVKLVIEYGARLAAAKPLSGRFRFPANGMRSGHVQGIDADMTPIKIALSHDHWNIAELLTSYNTMTSRSSHAASYHPVKWSPLGNAIQECLIEWSQEFGEIRICEPWCGIFASNSMDIIHRLHEQGVLDHEVLRSHLSHCVMYHGVKSTASITADVFAKDEAVDSALLDAAVYHGDYNFVQESFQRLEYKQKHSKASRQCGSSALIVAVVREDLTMVHLLLQLGVDPYQSHGRSWVWKPDALRYIDTYFFRTFSLDTAFQVALYQTLFYKTRDRKGRQTAGPCLDIIRLLIDWKDPGINNGQTSKTPQLAAGYIQAIVEDHAELKKLFGQHGFNDQRFQTDLRYTIPKQQLERALQYGLRKLQYCDFYTLKSDFDESVRTSLKAGVTSLLKLGVGFDVPALCSTYDSPGWHTPLQYAVILEDVTSVQQLLELGASVNAAPGVMAGATALQFAAMKGNFQIFDILLNAGAEVNAVRAAYRGRTAIEGAAEWGRLDMTSYLLANGADIAGKNNGSYRRAVCRSWREGHYALANLIQEWKKEHFGEDDCEDTQVICKTITHRELEHEPGHNERCREDCGVWKFGSEDEGLTSREEIHSEEIHESESDWQVRYTEQETAEDGAFSKAHSFARLDDQSYFETAFPDADYSHEYMFSMDNLLLDPDLKQYDDLISWGSNE